MIEKILPSLFYILPLGGVAYSLYKFRNKQKDIMKVLTEDHPKRKSISIKMNLSLIGAFAATILCILWICLIWIPNIEFPYFIRIVFIVLMVPFLICGALIGGLGKAVEAGAGSATGILNQAKGEICHKEKVEKSLPRKWERKSDIEVTKMKEQLKKSSYSPTFPIGSFIIAFLLCHFFIFKLEMATLKYKLICSFIAFILAYTFQIFKGRSFAKSPSFKICNKCHNEDRIGRKECGCGGEFESPEFYNFIEETQDIQEVSK